jgi:hypothetical protein
VFPAEDAGVAQEWALELEADRARRALPCRTKGNEP